jgi:hypothetical protein
LSLNESFSSLNESFGVLSLKRLSKNAKKKSAARTFASYA